MPVRSNPSWLKPSVALPGIAAGGLVTFLLPEFAPALAWPFFFAIPGILLIRRVLPGVTAPGALGIGVVLSVVGSAQLTYLLAVPLGFNRGVTVLAAVVLAAFSWFLLSEPLPWLLAPKPFQFSWSAAGESWKAHKWRWISGCGGGVITGLILSQGLFHHIAGNGWVSGGANWSDFLLHVSIAASIQNGNFPPETPFLAGVPLVYHWFGDFHSAIVATVAGAPLIPVMGMSTAAMTAALGLIVSELAWQLFANVRAAVIAPLLTLFSGGIGWIQLPIDLANHKGTLVALLRSGAYDFNYSATTFPVFHIPPLYQVGILVQRATAYGLPIMVAVVLILWLSAGRARAGVFIAGALAALSAPFNFFTLPVIYLLAGGIFVLRLLRKETRSWSDLFWFAAPLLYGAFFVAGPYLHRAQQNHVQFVLGWQDTPANAGFWGLVFFYATNLGIPFILAVLALVWRKTPARWLLGGWLVLLFLVPNFVQVSVVAFDSSKFFQLMWPAAALLAAWMMRNWKIWVTVPVLVVCCLSGAAGAIWVLEDTRAVLSDAEYAAAQWIETQTPDNAVFVTATFINMPTDLAGRERLAGFFTYASDQGFDQTQRDADVQAIYCTQALAGDLMRQYNANYVLSFGGLLDCKGHAPTDFDNTPGFHRVYDAGGVTIWKFSP